MGETRYEDVIARLQGAGSPTERRLHFAALLASAIGASADEFIIVGGSAIEVYTRGEYTSGDIDIVLSPSRSVAQVLQEWRFKQQGRIWYNDELGIVLDFVKPPYTYDVSRTQVFVTPFGAVRVAAIEDLLVNRLISAKWWRQPRDLDHAKLLAVLYRDRIDWAYVEDLAVQFEVGDVLANLRRSMSST